MVSATASNTVISTEGLNGPCQLTLPLSNYTAIYPIPFTGNSNGQMLSFLAVLSTETDYLTLSLNTSQQCPTIIAPLLETLG
jgi:hypothetical protein